MAFINFKPVFTMYNPADLKPNYINAEPLKSVVAQNGRITTVNDYLHTTKSDDVTYIYSLDNKINYQFRRSNEGVYVVNKDILISLQGSTLTSCKSNKKLNLEFEDHKVIGKEISISNPIIEIYHIDDSYILIRNTTLSKYELYNNNSRLVKTEVTNFIFNLETWTCSKKITQSCKFCRFDYRCKGVIVFENNGYESLVSTAGKFITNTKFMRYIDIINNNIIFEGNNLLYYKEPCCMSEPWPYNGIVNPELHTPTNAQLSARENICKGSIVLDIEEKLAQAREEIEKCKDLLNEKRDEIKKTRRVLNYE